MFKKALLGLLVATFAAGLVYGAGPVFGGGEDGLEKADAARQKHTATILAKPGVVAVAVGFNPAGEAAVKVYTEDAEVPGIPGELDGVPVHKQVSGKIMAVAPSAATATALTTTDRWARPVPIGVSTGHPDITACTIGARLTDGSAVYALSNNHCYARTNDADIGDAVIQPGTYDGGSSPGDDIGNLHDYEPLIFGNFGKCLMRGKQCNYMDAAIAATTTNDLGNATPGDGYGTPDPSVALATVGMEVKKYGRTTIETHGLVDSINASVRVSYDSGTATFVEQIIITPGGFSAGGDSGSLIVSEDGNNPVALLFAGSSTVTIGSPIGLILERFNVTIDGGSGGSTSPTPTPTPTPQPPPGITVNPTTGLVTSESGGQDTFTVVLDAQPLNDVRIDLSSSNTDEGTVAPNVLTFTADDWDTPQTVTVTGVEDDGTVDGDVDYMINTSAANSADADYNGMASDDVSVTNTDNDSIAGADDMGIFDISWNSKKRNLAFTVNVRQDSDAGGFLTVDDSPVELAHVLATLAHDANGDGIFDCSADSGDTCWSNFGGDTNNDGNVTFKLVGGAPLGDYQAEVTGLTHGTYTWVQGLDVVNPSTFTR